MARGEQELSSQSSPQPSIDQLLHGLLDRPNVESAIILSRKDGSIIRASGFSAVEKRRRARSLVGRQTLHGEPAAEQLGLGTSNEQAEDVSRSPAEELAVSILQCVEAADSLGSVLTAVSSEEECEDFASRKPEAEAAGSELDGGKASRSDESAVQLLRLRLKEREIIVFPDPRYLCCVVQHVGKQTGAAGR